MTTTVLIKSGPSQKEMRFVWFRTMAPAMLSALQQLITSIHPQGKH